MMPHMSLLLQVGLIRPLHFVLAVNVFTACLGLHWYRLAALARPLYRYLQLLPLLQCITYYTTKPRPNPQNVDLLNAISQCTATDNSITTCYPTNETVVVQDSAVQRQDTQSIYLVWNPRVPLLTLADELEVSLYRDDSSSEQPVYSWTLNAANPTRGDAGVFTVPVDDVLTRLNNSWTGTNIITPMYFTVASSTSGGGKNAIRQATFQLVQTGPIPLPNVPAVAHSSALASESQMAPNPVKAIATGPNLPSPSSSTDGTVGHTRASPGTIAGVVVGVAAALVIVVLATWLLARRNSSQARSRGSKVFLRLKRDEETGSAGSCGDEEVAVQGTQ
ncbi:unnamed protein product [Peniophora sp. CBMAI 1063]|nr:unnamed protein product [Peniophora sp. CBMAI 1063]